MRVQRDSTRGDVEVRTQLRGVTRILAGNQRDLAHDALRARTEVLQIPDRSRHDVDAALRLGYAHVRSPPSASACARCARGGFGRVGFRQGKRLRVGTSRKATRSRHPRSRPTRRRACGSPPAAPGDPHPSPQRTPTPRGTRSRGARWRHTRVRGSEVPAKRALRNSRRIGRSAQAAAHRPRGT